MTTQYLLNEQVERVLAALTPVNRLAMRVALHTGLRISDVLSLRTDDLKRGPRWWVREAKTGKAKLVALPKDLYEDLCRYAGAKWVFECRTDARKHRTRQAVWKDVKRAAKAFRLPQNVGPHSARKVYAVRLRERYGDLRKVERALNHSDVSVTMIYAMADKLLTDKARKPRKRA